MRKYIEITLTSSMQAALERYMVEKRVSMLDAAAAQILVEFLYKGGLFLMDDLQITISLTELMTLIESAKRVPDAEKALSSLSRRLDGLYGIYTEVLERLRALQHEVDSL